MTENAELGRRGSGLRRGLWAVIAGMAAAASATAAAAAVPIAQIALPGCHPEWPAVAHHAGGQRVSPPAGSSPPVACATQTGFATSESTVAVSNSGAIFYSPAQTENTMARSLDNGATWNLVQPPVMQYTALWNTDDPYVIADRRTGRIFWVHVTGPTRTTPILVSNSPLPGGIPTAIAFAYGFQVYSTDDGQNWTTADYSTAPMTDWEKIAAGPAPPASSGAAQPTGYPDIVYVCANSPFEVSGPGRLCYRSLDGGATFALAGYVFSAATPAVCPPVSSDTQLVGNDGALYVPMTCAGGAHLAISHDEGSTFSWLPITGAPGLGSGSGVTGVLSHVQVAIDEADNLYAMWLSNDQINVAVSRNHGQAWSAPLAVTAPGVHGIALPALTSGPAGHVGIAYYGTTASSATYLNAYMTETAGALDPTPLFYSVILNDSAHPICSCSGFNDHPRADYVGASYDAVGNLWAGLVKNLGPAPNSSADMPTTGYVARLVSAAAASPGEATGAAAATSAHLGLANTRASSSAAPAAGVALLLAAALPLVRRRRRTPRCS